ncbi:hypothetical protein FB45DRAFT_1018913 [Roridomyces roridus]|uniref:Uncharacterized protein n=1 Tax=Roridomyces roridus TaxID=1738132 RepID=A0AAD7CDS3_9AGAR|nr:hypothetical protein FB45DRAFT_1018913 [Roridomyces roridus]
MRTTHPSTNSKVLTKSPLSLDQVPVSLSTTTSTNALSPTHPRWNPSSAAAPAASTTKTMSTSTSTRGSSSTMTSLPPVSMPRPVNPDTLSMKTPSHGNDDVLPPPRRGAPPVAPARVTQQGQQNQTRAPEQLDPALCEGW